MRVGVGGLSCESCTFSPLLSREHDFDVLRGKSLIENYDFPIRYPDVEFVPLVHARALPGGPIDRVFYDKIKDEILEGLTLNGPWDGVLLHMHGAANVVDVDDMEGDLFASVRKVVGPDCLLSASYDLHGNVSHEVIRSLDILTAYRTAPHADSRETVDRSCDLLIGCLRRGEVPTKAYIPIPVLLPGEKTSTDWEPAASLYKTIPSVIDDYDLIDASILIGYLWADEPRSTASVITLGMDAERGNAAAGFLARRFWEARTQFRYGTYAGSADDCIGMALESAEKPVVISDSGDNPTAGGAGDVPFVLERLLAHNVSSALLAGLVDRAAVDSCMRAGVGARVVVNLGGKLDTKNGKPLGVSGDVISIHPDAKPAGEPTNRATVLKIEGVRVILTERRTPFHYLEDFYHLGVDPGEYKIVVVKIGYLVPELKRLAAKSLLALSPGAVNQDIEELSFAHLRRPMFPFDPDMEWTPPERSLV